MARIKDSSVRDVVAAADMVEVVSGRTQLRRASGSRFTGRCPFHEEKTPSFSVNPVEKLYYCFGCGKGGDVISFVRETESLDFVGAVEWLAERFRVPIEVEEASPRIEAERERQRAAVRGARPDDVATSSACCGTATQARRFASTSRGAGWARRSRRSSASGSPRARGSRTRRRSAASRSTSSSRGPRHDARHRLLPAAPDVPARGRARARPRLPGAQAARTTIRCAGST